MESQQPPQPPPFRKGRIATQNQSTSNTSPTSPKKSKKRDTSSTPSHEESPSPKKSKKTEPTPSPQSNSSEAREMTTMEKYEKLKQMNDKGEQFYFFHMKDYPDDNQDSKVCVPLSTVNQIEQFIFKKWETNGIIRNESGGSTKFSVFDFFAWRIGYLLECFYDSDVETDNEYRLRCDPDFQLEGKKMNPLKEKDREKWKQYILELNEMECPISLTCLKTFYVVFE